MLIAPTESEWVEEVEMSLPVVCAERGSTSTLQRPNFYKNPIVKTLVSEAFRGIWYSLEVIFLVWLFQGEAGSIALVDVANVSILPHVPRLLVIYTVADLAG